jgi:hypothetical protein
MPCLPCDPASRATSQRHRPRLLHPCTQPAGDGSLALPLTQAEPEPGAHERLGGRAFLERAGSNELTKREGRAVQGRVPRALNGSSELVELAAQRRRAVRRGTTGSYWDLGPLYRLWGSRKSA